MNGQILGVDKLHLSTKDFKVKEVNSKIFGIDTNTPEGHEEGELPHLLTDGRGREVRAWKIFHNGKKGNSLGKYTVNDKGLLVAFNPSKLIHPYQLSELHSKSYRKAIDLIRGELKSIGIIADFDQMKMARTDFAKQSQMSLPCYQYEQAFRLMKGKRVKERVYEGGYMFGNKSNQTMFYDKAQEMRYQKLDSILQGEKNFMRGEVRFMKPKCIAGSLKVATLSEFHQLSPADVEGVYKAHLTSRIFSKQNEGQQLLIDFNDEVEIIRQYKNMITRHAWQQYLLDAGSFDMIIAKFGSIEGFGKACEMAGYKRTQVWAIRQSLKDMLYRKAQFDKVRNDITPSTLIAELQERFAA